MSVKAIYPRLAMMLTMAMPAMKRSALIMASVPLRLPSPMVPKKIRTDPSVSFSIRGSDPETRELIFLIPPFPSGPARPGGAPWAAGEGDFAICRALRSVDGGGSDVPKIN